MRGCHKEVMQEYHRQNNAEQRDKPMRRPLCTQGLALRNLESRLKQAVKIYIEEAGIGE